MSLDANSAFSQASASAPQAWTSGQQPASSSEALWQRWQDLKQAQPGLRARDAGELLLQCFGTRKGAESESPQWRALLDDIADPEHL